MVSAGWVQLLIADDPSVSDEWAAIFARLAELALSSSSPAELHNQTIAPDRLLAESAWDLWFAYQSEAPKTADVLKRWCAEPSPSGRAVLILDALSLRELPLLLGGAASRAIKPVDVRVTGSEVPSDTDQFARALGTYSRSNLSNNGASAAFVPFNGSVYTDVISRPFEDSVGTIPASRNLFIWHTWLDDLIHLHNRLPDQIYKAAQATLQGDDFWEFVDRLRRGRQLVITADHGYAVSRLFSSEVVDPDLIETLRSTFGAARYKKATERWQDRFMPPLVMTVNGYHVVMGQRKWKVQGGFPHLCHGGLSLLEVAVPFVELPPG
jgi:hypothetical protein